MSTSKNKSPEDIDVLLIFRKQKPHFFSIENVFNIVAGEIAARISMTKIFLLSEKTSIAGMFKNISYLRSFKAKVYHITGEVYYASLILPRKKTIITIHDCTYATGKSVKGRLIKYFLLSLPVKRVRSVIAISERTKEDIIALTGCDPAKIEVISNPIDKRFSYAPKQYNYQKPVVLQVGTRWNKNFDRVAAALIGISCQLRVIGSMSPEQIDFLVLNNIEYLNYQNLTDEELLQQYTESDMLVFASLSEGFGLPIIEAQAIGRPVLTSNLRPMSDVAGDAALQVNPYDTEAIREGILKIMQNTDYREELIQKGLVNVKKYRTDIASEQYLALYNRIMIQ